MSQLPLCWHQGSIRPASEVAVPVLDHGLLYGDGVFEGLRFYYGRAFRLERHLQRLRQSLRAVGISLGEAQLQAIPDIIASLIEHSQLTQGYLRILITRGAGAMGVSTASCASAGLYILLGNLAVADAAQVQRGLRLTVASVRRATDTGVDSRIKSLNYLTSVLAKREAEIRGFDEALLLNTRGTVAEASVANLFAVQRGGLRTPPVTDGALGGITRGGIIELAQAADIRVQEESLTPYDLSSAEEIFLTGSGARLIPVREIDGTPVPQCPGPVFRLLAEAFEDAIRKECGA